jgi:hypothetical protein
MFHHMYWSRVAVRLVALVAVIVLACPTADAQVKPFKITGGGTVDYVPLVDHVPVFHWAAGNATHLGNYYCEGYVQLLGFTSANTADFNSAQPCVFTAANGDKLVFTYGDTANGAAQAGYVTLLPAGDGQFIAVWVAEFNPVPALCTGRFANVVAGSFIMTAVTEPFSFGDTDVVYNWSGDGWIKFQK